MSIGVFEGQCSDSTRWLLKFSAAENSGVGGIRTASLCMTDEELLKGINFTLRMQYVVKVRIWHSSHKAYYTCTSQMQNIGPNVTFIHR